MKKFFKLIRIENIIIVLLTQWLMSFAVIKPILALNQLEVATPPYILAIIMIGTALITMGGYVINDYFDTRIDEINKPHRVLIGKAISRHKAMSLHQIVTIIGSICGLFVAWQAHSYTIAMIFLFIPGLLWFYSTTYKRQFFIGNLVVGFITAFVPMIVVLVERQYLVDVYGTDVLHYGLVADLYKWVGFFAVFAFALTIIREMVKDLEDEEGDREMECRTVPIVLGKYWSKVIITAFALLLIMAIMYLLYGHWAIANIVSIKYFLLYGVCVPIVIFILLLTKAETPKDYARTQLLLKVIMLLGVLFSLVFPYAI